MLNIKECTNVGADFDSMTNLEGAVDIPAEEGEAVRNLRGEVAHTPRLQGAAGDILQVQGSHQWVELLGIHLHCRKKYIIQGHKIRRFKFNPMMLHEHSDVKFKSC